VTAAWVVVLLALLGAALASLGRLLRVPVRLDLFTAGLLAAGALAGLGVVAPYLGESRADALAPERAAVPIGRPAPMSDPDAAVERLVGRWDRDGDGVVAVSEHAGGLPAWADGLAGAPVDDRLGEEELLALAAIPAEVRGWLSRVLARHDADGDRRLDAQELGAVAAGADLDGDGALDLEELTAWRLERAGAWLTVGDPLPVAPGAEAAGAAPAARVAVGALLDPLGALLLAVLALVAAGLAAERLLGAPDRGGEPVWLAGGAGLLAAAVLLDDLLLALLAYGLGAAALAVAAGAPARRLVTVGLTTLTGAAGLVLLAWPTGAWGPPELLAAAAAAAPDATARAVGALLLLVGLAGPALRWPRDDPSGVLVLGAGLGLVLRTAPLAFPVAPTVAGCGALLAAAGGALALRSRDLVGAGGWLRDAVLGLGLLTVGLGAPARFALHLPALLLALAAWQLAAGAAARARGSAEAGDLGGLRRRLPLAYGAGLVAAAVLGLAAAGPLPALGGPFGFVAWGVVAACVAGAAFQGVLAAYHGRGPEGRPPALEPSPGLRAAPALTLAAAALAAAAVLPWAGAGWGLEATWARLVARAAPERLATGPLWVTAPVASAPSALAVAAGLLPLVAGAAFAWLRRRAFRLAERPAPLPAVSGEPLERLATGAGRVLGRVDAGLDAAWALAGRGVVRLATRGGAAPPTEAAPLGPLGFRRGAAIDLGLVLAGLAAAVVVAILTTGG